MNQLSSHRATILLLYVLILAIRAAQAGGFAQAWAALTTGGSRPPTVVGANPTPSSGSDPKPQGAPFGPPVPPLPGEEDNPDPTGAYHAFG